MRREEEKEIRGGESEEGLGEELGNRELKDGRVGKSERLTGERRGRRKKEGEGGKERKGDGSRKGKKGGREETSNSYVLPS